MANAQPVGSSQISLPPNSYIYKIEPVLSKLAVISSDDSLRSVDRSTLQVDDNGTCRTIHRGVTCLTTSTANNCLLTAGRDGSVRGWDTRCSLSTSEFGGGRDARPLLSLAANVHNHMMATGTELVSSSALIQLWYPPGYEPDAPGQPLCEYAESHNDDVTQLAFHPTDPKVLLSGSTDGLVNLYDTTISDEDEVLLQVWNHGSSIAHAGFVSEKQLFALSHDEKLTIYGLSHSEPSTASAPIDHGDLRPRLGCEYVCGLSTLADGNAVVGAGSSSEHRMGLIPLNAEEGWQFPAANRTMRLEGAHGEDIVRTFYMDEKSTVIYSGGEDGYLRAFRPDRDASATERGAVSKPMRSKDKKSKGKRFKPY